MVILVADVYQATYTSLDIVVVKKFAIGILLVRGVCAAAAVAAHRNVVTHNHGALDIFLETVDKNERKRASMSRGSGSALICPQQQHQSTVLALAYLLAGRLSAR